LGDSSIAVATAAVVWLQFGVLDHAMSGQFVRHDLWSPDEFHFVDEHVWWLNGLRPGRSLATSRLVSL